LRFIVAYSWVRFVVEWFRFGEGGSAEILIKSETVGAITVAQAASLAVIVVGSLLIWIFSRMAEPKEDDEAGGSAKGDLIAPGKLVVRETPRKDEGPSVAKGTASPTD